MPDSAPEVDKQFEWVLDLDLSRSPDEQAVSRPVLRKAGAPAQGRAEASPALAEILAKVPLFHGLHKPQLKKLLQLCMPISFAEGERVCAMGEPSDRVLILLSGELAVSMGDGVRVATVRPVTTVGEMGFVTHWQRTVTLIAAAPCSMMAIPNARLQALLQSDTDLHLRMLKSIVAIMAARIVNLNAHMRQQLLKDGDTDKTPS